MKKILLAFAICFFVASVNAQTAIIKVTDSTDNQPLGSVSITNLSNKKNSLTKEDGTYNLQTAGLLKLNLMFTATGYKPRTINISLPVPDTVFIVMLPNPLLLDNVTVSSTRSSSRIADLPIKVEVLGIEEMNEESSIKPGNVSSLLGDLSVIHIQNTSPTNGSQAIRMQGLDGKYTQLLRDGLPVYEGLSGNFGVLSIPPLDLKQIEIIKGSVSTLYGGGAIAGIINFISKTPSSEPEFTALVNHSTLTENNINAFYSHKLKKFGTTIFASTTQQNAQDVNNDGISEIPKLQQYIFHPKFFFYASPKTTLLLGYTGTYEKRTSGDIIAVNNSISAEHPYLEINNSNRNSIDFQLTSMQLSGGTLNIKGVASFFGLTNTEAGFLLNGKQANSYGEISYNKKWENHTVVFGVNTTNENFSNHPNSQGRIADYNYSTNGIFVQDGYHINQKLMVEAGLRVDNHNIYGWFILPRLALVYKPIDALSVRLSAGEGYKTPNVFSSANSEGVSFSDLYPFKGNIIAEKSTGLNADINYRVKLGNELTMTLNQAFYYTHINNPLEDLATGAGFYFTSAAYHTKSFGTDTYIRLKMDELELYLGYNHTVSKNQGGTVDFFVPLAPQDKFSSTLGYEIEGKWRFGIENSWAANQYNYNGIKVPNYWFWASSIMHNIGKHLLLVLNGENLFDYRQAKVENLFIGSIKSPVFSKIWGPLEGRVINFSVKYNL